MDERSGFVRFCWEVREGGNYEAERQTDEGQEWQLKAQRYLTV